MQGADFTVFAGCAKILAAVSSGGDSVALFWLLKQANLNFAVAHINHDLHELRCGDCETDELFVRELSERAGVDFHARRLDLPRRSGHVNEEVARTARYGALLNIAREVGADVVATAHTSDDLLEGAILNLLRGGGFGGWSGFAPTRELGKGVILARPLSHLTREQLRFFLGEIGQKWREDASNGAREFARNRVRHEILPLMAEVADRKIEILARGFAVNAAIARDESSFMSECAQEALGRAVVERRGETGTSFLALDARIFRGFAPAIQRRVLRLGAHEVATDARGLEFRKIETLRLCVQSDAKRQVWCWRGDLRAEWTGAACGNRIRLWRV